jgi:phenylacetate-CoA ligase
MFLPKTLVKTALYPLHERFKGQRTAGCYREMRAREEWPAERLREFQLESLQRLVRLAYDHAPFYRERFDARGITPGDIRSFEDFARLPSITKDDIRVHRDRMVTLPEHEHHRLVNSSTGGSTGAPMQFYVDRGTTAGGWAACWRARAWWQLDWGDSWFWLWGSPIELGARDTFQHAVKKLRDVFVNRRVLSAFDMTDEGLARYARRILRERPRYLYAYSSAAYVLADYILKHNIDLGSAAPRVVFATSDMLYPHMREAIERAFHCPVSLEYGARETGFVAHECPAGGLHIHSDRVHVEVVDGDTPVAPGEVGEIVITVLDATAMPFLRYRTADLGSLDNRPCSCGLPFPLLRSLEGRSDDVLLGRDHRVMHSMAVIYYIKEIPGIAQFRIYQDSVEKVRLDVVRTAPDAEVPRERIVEALRKQFGFPVEVDIRFVDQLAPTASGKHRSVVSSLTRDYFKQKRGTAAEVR